MVSRTSRSPQIAAGIHALLVIGAAIGILVGNEPDWPLVWIGFLVVDFPISLAFAALNQLAPLLPRRLHIVAGYSPINDIWNFLAPVTFFGIVGSLWWLLLLKWSRALRATRGKDGAPE